MAYRPNISALLNADLGARDRADAAKQQRQTAAVNRRVALEQQRNNTQKAKEAQQKADEAREAERLKAEEAKRQKVSAELFAQDELSRMGGQVDVPNPQAELVHQPELDDEDRAVMGEISDEMRNVAQTDAVLGDEISQIQAMVESGQVTASEATAELTRREEARAANREKAAELQKLISGNNKLDAETEQLDVETGLMPDKFELDQFEADTGRQNADTAWYKALHPNTSPSTVINMPGSGNQDMDNGNGYGQQNPDGTYSILKTDSQGNTTIESTHAKRLDELSNAMSATFDLSDSLGDSLDRNDAEAGSNSGIGKWFNNTVQNLSLGDEIDDWVPFVDGMQNSINADTRMERIGNISLSETRHLLGPGVMTNVDAERLVTIAGDPKASPEEKRSAQVKLKEYADDQIDRAVAMIEKMDDQSIGTAIARGLIHPRLLEEAERREAEANAVPPEGQISPESTQEQTQNQEATLPQVRSMEEAMALPAGTVFLDPNGVRRTR